jgi:dihydrofolate synthase/folylpolyglutamate synthase
MTVAMAYDHFAKENVDFAILETGMGGRLDSTNISQPILTVITNIGFDHIQFLGNTIEMIASEKAGIVKEKIPLIVGRKQPGADKIFTKMASEKHAPILYADDHFELKELQTREKNCLIYDIWKDNQLYTEKLISPLMGRYQNENLATVLQCIELLNKNGETKVNTEAITEGIFHVVDNTSLLGRWQVISNNPLTICDTGHNQDGIQAVVNQINEMNFGHLHFVFGMVNDKNPEDILYLLPKNATYYFCKPDIPRGMNAEDLKEHAFKAGLRGDSYNSVQHAYNSAINNAGMDDLVFVGGSTFVVAEIV